MTRSLPSKPRVGPNLGVWLIDWSVWNVQRDAPACPRLVKIWMTPDAASVPYSVVAAGPLITSMRSMSEGSMSLRGL